MSDILLNISAKNQYKLLPILTFNNEYLAFIVDFTVIQIIEYNKSGQIVRVNYLCLLFFLINIFVLNE
jgi:hypothetical protein